MSARNLEVGRFGEKAARDYLRSCGYTILVHNWRGGGGELDLVCRQGQQIVFVEVKTRSENSKALPVEALDQGKQRRLIRAASAFLTKNRLWDAPCRFDVISVYLDRKEQHYVEHHPHAFALTNPLGRGHTSWQPW